MKENVIQIKSYDFALKTIKLYQQHYQKSMERSLFRQLLNSATSVGANVEEAEGAQSKRDFIAKMSISYKEARETKYWLKLLRDSHLIENGEANQMISECEELIRILTAILNSSKNS